MLVHAANVLRPTREIRGRMPRRDEAESPSGPVITGWGMITPFGDTEATWSALVAGKRLVEHGRVTGLSGSGGGRAVELAQVAAGLACASGWRDVLKRTDTALVIGTSKGPIEQWMIAAGGFDGSGLGEIAAALGNAFEMTGPRLTVSAACASGLAALIRGAMLIRADEARRVLVVASESSLHPLFLGAFSRMGVLAPAGYGCRPFDRERKGFAVSEAAAAVFLEAWNPESPEDEQVRMIGLSGRPSRGAQLAVVDRFALAADAHHVTSADPQGRVVRRVLESVIDVTPVDLIHAHGTGTDANDAVELAAIDAAAAGDWPLVYSHKGALGHSLGAAGLLSVVVNLMSHERGVVPPIAGLRQPLAAKRVDLCRSAVERKIDRSVALAAGFGGTVAVVGLRSVEREWVG